MASLALGLAGAGIGSFFGPLGTALGWSAGAMLGSMIGRKNVQSPQLKDLRVQTSEYGTPIPIGFGTIRIAGWLEWAADKVPHTHEESAGGKGGPKVTTTTYTCSFAIGLLETSFLDRDGALVNNPISGILRIWANGRLVWGETSAADSLPITVYYGTEDQLPDPTIESYEGAGEVSANRGKAYVVFTDLALAPYGDMIPNFTFEVVCSGGEVGLEYYALWPVDYDYPVDGHQYSYPHGLNGVESTAGQLTLHRYRSGANYGPPFDPSNALFYDQRRYDLQGNLLGADDQIVMAIPDTVNIAVYGSMNSGIAYAKWQQIVDCTLFFDDSHAIDTEVNTFAWLKDGNVTYTPSSLQMCAASASDGAVIPEYAGDISLNIYQGGVYWNGNYYAVAGDGGDTAPHIRRWPAPDGAVYTLDHDADCDLSVYTLYGVSSGANDLVVGDGFLYCLTTYPAGSGGPGLPTEGIKLIKLDADLNIVQAWINQPGLGQPGYSSFVIFRGHIITNINIGVWAFTMYRLNGDGTTTLVDQLLADTLVPAGVPSPLIYIGQGRAAFRGGILSLGSGGTITLGEMVANVSQHVGYAEDEYDVSQLTDVVRGACISQRTSGRAAIEAWQPAYQFGAVESNFEVKFVKWGGTVSATIPDADLGAREYGTDPVEPLKRTATGDKDLPRTVEALFLNKNMDYQEGMQYWEGPTRSDLHIALSMALVFTDSEGKAIAENVGVNALVERNKYTFSLPRKYADLEPTDVIAINEQPIRIINKDEQGYTHIAFDGISTRIGEWIVAPVAAEVVYVPQALPVTIPTNLLMLDTALARDTDYQIGFNVAAAGATSGSWPGAGLYKSIDGGASYASIAAMITADTFGVATSVLGDFAGGNIVDETNIFTVRLTPGSGDLDSTNYLGLINGANLFALGTEAGGYELAQFRTATLIGTAGDGSKTYQLSGLLRGRRGTEWAMSTHADDNFVLLPAHNLEGVLAELGAERLYKAVTSGSTLSSATAVAFTNNGIALKPYAPVLLGGGRNSAGDIIINWTRRTRIGGAWQDYVDVPLSEPIEEYQVDFYTDGTYSTNPYGVGVVTPTYTFTAADQVTYMGGLQNPLYVSVFQFGSYQPGYEARAII